jgi:hypothetical protein
MVGSCRVTADVLIMFSSATSGYRPTSILPENNVQQFHSMIPNDICYSSLEGHSPIVV